jgi:hypothetical protein
LKFACGLTVPPVATLPFHDRLATVTFLPDCVHVPFQPLCSAWFPAYEYVRVQLVQAVPVLVMVTLAPKPDPESQVVAYVAVHPAAAWAGVAATAARPPAISAVAPAAASPLRRRLVLSDA